MQSRLHVPVIALKVSSNFQVSFRRGTKHLAWPTLGLAAAILAGVLVLKTQTTGAVAQSHALMSAHQPVNAAAPPIADTRSNNQQRYVNILARPLFSRDRRPPVNTSTQGADTPGALPRLSGVVVSSAGAFAIFSSDGSGKPIVLGEGGRVGAAIIETITAGQVTLRGTDGIVVLRPAFGAGEKALQLSALSPADPAVPGYGSRPTGQRAAFWRAVATNQPNGSR